MMTRFLRLLTTWALALQMTISPFAAAAATGNDKKCIDDLTKASSTVTAASSPAAKERGLKRVQWDTKAAWEQSQLAIKDLEAQVVGKGSLFQMLYTTSIAREFAWLNGDPGGAKTFAAKALYDAQLAAIPESDKKNFKIFVLQFHKLLTEGYITGFQKVQKFLDTGEYDIETSTSLVGDEYVFTILDEIEKGNPAVLAALLSVMNERKAFLGTRVVDAVLSSGVVTSNKTVQEFLESFGEDLPTGEALLDRIAAKFHVINQQDNAFARVRMVKASQAARKKSGPTPLPLWSLNTLLEKVQIPDSLYPDIAKVIYSYDRETVTKFDNALERVRNGERDGFRPARGYFPANQASNRSNIKTLQMFKAAFLAEQLRNGVPFEKVRLTPTREDLHLLATSMVYGTTGGVRRKREVIENMKVVLKLGDTATVNFEYDRYLNRLYFVHPQDKSEVVVEVDLKDGKILGAPDAIRFEGEPLKALLAKIKAIEATPRKIEFEADPSLALVMQMKTLTGDTKAELAQILEDQQSFAQVLNHVVKESEDNNFSKLVAGITKRLSFHREKALEILNKIDVRKGKLTKEEIAALWDINAQTYRDLEAIFPGMAYGIQALMGTILNAENMYAFGPPGGAKTLVVNTIFQRELEGLRTLNHNPNMTLFFQQFHKLLPEGVITGFAVPKSQMDSGRLEFNYQNTLSDPNAVFGILDEVEKGHEGLLTRLLSMSNERSTFNGVDNHKSGIRSLVFTSNKTVAEFIDSFKTNPQTGKALMSRAINKVFFLNKFPSAEKLGIFLYMADRGHLSTAVGPMVMTPLAQLLEDDSAVKVTVNDVLLLLASQVYSTFTGRMLEYSEKSFWQHKYSPQEQPYYYVPAADPSDRTFEKLVRQWKANFLVQQLASGVKFDDAQLKLQHKDLGLLFRGAGYWGSHQVKPTYNRDGVLEFESDLGDMAELLNSGVYNQRIRFQIQEMIGDGKELDTFVKTINEIIPEHIKELRDIIAKFPNLFPTLQIKKSDAAGKKEEPSTNNGKIGKGK